MQVIGKRRRMTTQRDVGGGADNIVEKEKRVLETVVGTVSVSPPSSAPSTPKMAESLLGSDLSPPPSPSTSSSSTSSSVSPYFTSVGFIAWYCFVFFCCILPMCRACGYVCCSSRRNRRLEDERGRRGQRRRRRRGRRRRRRGDGDDDDSDVDEEVEWQRRLEELEIAFEINRIEANVKAYSMREQRVRKRALLESWKSRTMVVKEDDFIKDGATQADEEDYENGSCYHSCDDVDLNEDESEEDPNLRLCLPIGSHPGENMLDTKPLSDPEEAKPPPEQRRTVPSECAICIQRYKANDVVVWSIEPNICSHVFHEDCAATWLSTKQGPANSDSDNAQDAATSGGAAANTANGDFQCPICRCSFAKAVQVHLSNHDLSDSSAMWSWERQRIEAAVPPSPTPPTPPTDVANEHVLGVLDDDHEDDADSSDNSSALISDSDESEDSESSSSYSSSIGNLMQRTGSSTSGFTSPPTSLRLTELQSHSEEPDVEFHSSALSAERPPLLSDDTDERKMGVYDHVSEGDTNQNDQEMKEEQEHSGPPLPTIPDVDDSEEQSTVQNVQDGQENSQVDSESPWAEEEECVKDAADKV